MNGFLYVALRVISFLTASRQRNRRSCEMVVEKKSEYAREWIPLDIPFIRQRTGKGTGIVVKTGVLIREIGFLCVALDSTSILTAKGQTECWDSHLKRSENKWQSVPLCRTARHIFPALHNETLQRNRLRGEIVVEKGEKYGRMCSFMQHRRHIYSAGELVKEQAAWQNQMVVYKEVNTLENGFLYITRRFNSIRKRAGKGTSSRANRLVIKE